MLVGCLGCIHKPDVGYVTDGVVALCCLDDDVVDDVEIYVNDNVRDENEGNDDVVEDVVVFLDVGDVEMDVELVDGDVDVKDGFVETEVSKDKNDVVAVDDFEMMMLE